MLVKFGNNWKPVVLELVKSFGILWGTSQVESNSLGASGYAFEDAFQILAILFCIFGPKVDEN